MQSLRGSMLASRGKVLVLVENLPVPFDRRVWLEATTLSDAGYQVSVICPKGEEQYRESYLRLDGISIYRYELPVLGSGFVTYLIEYGVAMLMSLLLSVKVLHREGFDVIHACNPPDLFFLIGALYKITGRRFIFDQHDLSPETFYSRFGGRFRLIFKLMLVFEWLTYKTADLVITTNESMKGFAQTRGGLSADRVYIVRTGPDIARLHAVPAEPELKRGKRFLVAYLGVMGPYDGVDMALNAVREIVMTHGRKDVQFTFIGKGDKTTEFEKLARSLGVRDYVEFTGRISDADVRRYLSTADVCLSPDPANGLNEFNTMNKTMEYMAMARPVVAFDIRETRYSAQDAALYAQPNDTGEFARRILELLENPALRERLGQIGQERVRSQLGWEHTHKVLLAAYHELFSGQRVSTILRPGRDPQRRSPGGWKAPESSDMRQRELR